MKPAGKISASTGILQEGIFIVRKGQFYLMLVAYMVLATAHPETVMPAEYNDLVIHFTAYAVLFNSCLLAYGAGSNRLYMYLLLLGYSFLIEVVQYTLPYRSFSLTDMLANALGLYAGLWIGAGLIQIGTRFNLS